MPAVSLESKEFLNALAQTNLLPSVRRRILPERTCKKFQIKKQKSTGVCAQIPSFLSKIRSFADQYDGAKFVWILTGVTYVISLTTARFQ
jgi:hypothetical protein